MIIDCHNHPDWLGYDFAKSIKNMENCGIDQTWLLSWEGPHDEYEPATGKITPEQGGRGPIPFERCVSYQQQLPNQFILGYAPDPRLPESMDRLKMAIEQYGVRVYGEIKLRMMYDNPDAIRMFQFCGKMGLPVVAHIEYPSPSGSDYPRPDWWYGGGIAAFERAIQACPETIFIGHAPGFWAHIAADNQLVGYPRGKIERSGKMVQMLHDYKNLYCDISAGSGLNALTRDEKYAKRFLVEFQDRILFGRDGFGNEHRMFLERIGLPESVLAKIYSHNALKLVPLEQI